MSGKVKQGFEERTISPYKFNRVYNNPVAKRYLRVELGVDSETPKMDNNLDLRYNEYKKHYQYADLDLRVVLGGYVYYKRDGECYRRRVAADGCSVEIPSKIWYPLEDLVEGVSVEKYLRVNVGGWL